MFLACSLEIRYIRLLFLYYIRKGVGSFTILIVHIYVNDANRILIKRP